MKPCAHKWVARPDQSSDDVQRYRCERCDCWGWRRFLPALTPIKAYKRVPPEVAAEVTVRSTATLPGAGPDAFDFEDPATRRW